MGSAAEGCHRKLAYLPEEIIFVEILWRLPVKSLLRCQAVCKTWRSHITSPSFIELHLQRSSNPSNFIIVHSTTKYKSKYDNCDEDNLISLHNLDCPQKGIINLDLPYFGDDIKIHPLSEIFLAPTCNGIVCAVVIDPSTNHFTYLWNPATKRSKRLPPHILPDYDKDSVCFSIGFGFDPIDNDYKVVRVLNFEREGDYIRAEVYSANRNLWREIKVEERLTICESSCEACVKGVLYWDASKLVTFDLNKEVFKTFICPDLSEFGAAYSIVEFRDSVGVLLYESFGESEEVNLRSIDFDDQGGYSGSRKWTKKLAFQVFPNIRGVYAYLKTGEIIAKNNQEALFVYDPESKEAKHVPILARSRTEKVLINYTESLVGFS